VSDGLILRVVDYCGGLKVEEWWIGSEMIKMVEKSVDELEK
jgi:hypothetical protein